MIKYPICVSCGLPLLAMDRSWAWHTAGTLAEHRACAERRLRPYVAGLANLILYGDELGPDPDRVPPRGMIGDDGRVP